jgi:hypothetical protein
MIEKLIEGIGRRSFLSKLSAAAAALVCSVIGIKPNSVQAGGLVDYLCCHLCFEPSIDCNSSVGVCAWCWYCGPYQVNPTTCSKYKCTEHYSAAPCDTDGCINGLCSAVIYAGPVSCNGEVSERPCTP